MRTVPSSGYVRGVMMARPMRTSRDSHRHLLVTLWECCTVVVTLKLRDCDPANDVVRCDASEVDKEIASEDDDPGRCIVQYERL